MAAGGGTQIRRRSPAGFLANVEKMQHDRQKVGYILRLAAGLGTVHRASQRVSHSAGPNGTTHRLAVWAVMTTEHI